MVSAFWAPWYISNLNPYFKYLFQLQMGDVPRIPDDEDCLRLVRFSPLGGVMNDIFKGQWSC